MFLSLNKLSRKYGKRIVLIFYIGCIMPIFPFILSCFSVVSNAMNFFIHFQTGLFWKKTAYALLVLFSRVPYSQIYLLNACKLALEENLFDFYVKSIAFRIEILINFNLIISDSRLYNSNMRIGKYLNQTQAIK